MNYIEQLLKEHTRDNTNLIAKEIGNNPTEFKKIIAIILNEKAPLPQRASWLLSAVNDNHPELLTPYLPLFIDTVASFKIDGVKRNMMNVLSKHTIPEKYQGKLVAVCFNLMLSGEETVVVKTLAMQALANIANEHVELRKELKAAIENQLPVTTAAFHARAKRILKQF